MMTHRASKAKIICVKFRLFSYPTVLTCVLGAEKNRLIEAGLLSTPNIYPTKKETHHLELFNYQEEYKG